MDPATILSVTATCAKIAKIAWDLGEALYAFTKNAKVINKTLNSLIEQFQSCERSMRAARGIPEGRWPGCLCPPSVGDDVSWDAARQYTQSVATAAPWL